MRLLADESVDRAIIVRLRRDGHEVASVAEESPGLGDEEVLSLAYGQGLVLISADKDFGELVHRRRRPHAGVVLLRFSGLTEDEKCGLVSSVISEHAADRLQAVLDAGVFEGEDEFEAAVKSEIAELRAPEAR